MLRQMLFVVALVASLSPAASAMVHDMMLPTGPPAFAGSWKFGRDGEGSVLCKIALKTAGTIGGFQISVPSKCKGKVARYDDLTAWFVYKGQVRFEDGQRHVLYRLSKIGKGQYAGAGPDGQYLLVR